MSRGYDPGPPSREILEGTSPSRDQDSAEMWAETYRGSAGGFVRLGVDGYHAWRRKPGTEAVLGEAPWEHRLPSGEIETVESHQAARWQSNQVYEAWYAALQRSQVEKYHRVLDRLVREAARAEREGRLQANLPEGWSMVLGKEGRLSLYVREGRGWRNPGSGLSLAQAAAMIVGLREPPEDE